MAGIAELKASNFRALRRFKLSPGEHFQRIIRVAEGKRKKRIAKTFRRESAKIGETNGDNTKRVFGIRSSNGIA
jgi:hypothetical protein